MTATTITDMPTMPVPVLRFAPSPNGRMHAGHAYSAQLNAKLAATMGGRFLLRIEDIDTIRCTPELTAQCLDDLASIGLQWEVPVRIQSQHFADYAAALAQLKGRGLLYPCFCSRTDIARESTAADPEGAPLYPGTCRGLDAGEAAAHIAAGQPHAWRLDMARALAAAPGPHHYQRFTPGGSITETVTANPSCWGDVVLARKETPTSYHLSVVVDDALQGITHVVRGADLEAATDVHVLLQALLGLPTPLYHHHELIRDPAGVKLAKRLGSPGFAE